MTGKLVVDLAFIIEEMTSLGGFVTMRLGHIIIEMLMGFLKKSLQLESVKKQPG